MYCEKCGAEIDNNEKFCPKCGYHIEEVVEVIPMPVQEKKYCSKCGKQIYKEAVICPKCGCYTDSEEKKVANPEHSEPKTSMGVIMALFLGLIGLLIGVLLYPDGTVARKTFIKAWLKTYLICLGVVILFAIIIVAVGGIAAASL